MLRWSGQVDGAMAESRKLYRYALKVLTLCDVIDAVKSLGTDPRVKVSAGVFPVDCSAIFGFGYNGAASGLDHMSVLAARTGGKGSGSSGSAHAEANALMKAGDVTRREDCLMYVNVMPCPSCAALVANAIGVVGVLYSERMEGQLSGEQLLRAAGVPVVRVTDLAEEFADGKTKNEQLRETVSWWSMLRRRRRPLRPLPLNLVNEGEGDVIQE